MKPSDLEPEDWKRIDAIFEAALETSPAERRAFLMRRCGGDRRLRAEVEALLDARERADARFEVPRRQRDDALDSLPSPGIRGRKVGPFRLRREIGRGGMGVVYLAEDTRIGRRVALKALPPWLGARAGARARFLSEARAVAALDHPNIATLFEADATVDGQLYLAFAFYEGETLDARIRRGPLPLEEAIRIAARIAAGLDAAHRSGITHRDVKPSNVLLTDRGEVKLLDFGVAKVAGEEVTGEGVRPGTLAYMSPEQATEGPVDHRTDLWSLGVVLYEMLAGARPFRAEHPARLLRAIEHEEPEPLADLRDDLSDAIVRIVGRLLAKPADGRYGSASDLLAELAALPGADAASLPHPRPRRGARADHRGRSLALASLAGAIVVAIFVWLVAGDGSDASPVMGADPVDRVAVLPLRDITGAEGRGYLVEGVHEALISELGRIGSLGVLSRTSVARFRDSELSLPEIASRLEVDALIEGSVLVNGDSLAITTRLVQASPERLLWTGNYRRPLGDIYEVGGEVARRIAGELGITLSGTESARLLADRAVDPRAYDAYALGEFQVSQRNREGLEQAQRYFLEAIDIDSTFAPAYTGLAEALGSATFFGLLRPAETMPRVRALAESALRQDSSLADAHQILGAVALYWDWDWEAAERHMRTAIRMQPSEAGAHRTLSEVLAVQGRYAEALASVERGAELGRMVPFSTFRPVVVLNYMREFDQAIERSRSGLTFFSDFWQGHWLLCSALAGAGRHDEAVAACEEAVRLSDRASAPLGTLGYASARAGRREDAERIASELESRARVAYVGGTNLAAVYGGLDDLDRAFAWLDRAYEERDVSLVHLNNSVSFDPLRADPRFERLLDRIGLEPRRSWTGPP